MGVTLGAAGYDAMSDVNGDGIVNRADLRIARMNLGAATSIRPPIVTASLSPDSDPDGNGVVLNSTVTVVGQTQPGASVTLRVMDRSSAESRNTSDACRELVPSPLYSGERARVRGLRDLLGTNPSPQPSPLSTGARERTFDCSREGIASVADARGRFQFETELPPGLSMLRVTASDGFGQSVTVERDVRLGDVILDWNASLLNVIRDWTTLSNDPYTNRVVTERPPVAARNLAMVHAAMFDAVNAFEGGYRPYHVGSVAPAGASPVAAAAAAAHRVASNLYREADELAVFDAALAEALATVSDGPAESLGVELGEQVGDAILAWRANDGASAVVPYRPGTDPGDWDRTFPDFLPPLITQWPHVTPFAMTSSDQFRPAAPPTLDSAEYAAAVDEVRQLGEFASTTRTSEQTEIALFWADGGGTFTPPGHWNQIAADVATDRGNTVAENARLFALLNIALADAGISAWDAKYAYNLWRPIDAIRRGDDDGNELTMAEPTWIPLLKTPPFPTYTSGHSTFSGAADAVLSFFFGPDTHFSSTADGHTGFTQRPLAESQVVTRTFTSFAQAADEAGRSRIYGGIHFEFDNAPALAAGRAIGKFVVGMLLGPAN
jgi:hypothetical protein